MLRSISLLIIYFIGPVFYMPASIAYENMWVACIISCLRLEVALQRRLDCLCGSIQYHISSFSCRGHTTHSPQAADHFLGQPSRIIGGCCQVNN